jgi:hypothetical protein
MIHIIFVFWLINLSWISLWTSLEIDASEVLQFFERKNRKVLSFCFFRISCVISYKAMARCSPPIFHTKPWLEKYYHSYQFCPWLYSNDTVFFFFIVTKYVLKQVIGLDSFSIYNRNCHLCTLF